MKTGIDTIDSFDRDVLRPDNGYRPHLQTMLPVPFTTRPIR